MKNEKEDSYKIYEIREFCLNNDKKDVYVPVYKNSDESVRIVVVALQTEIPTEVHKKHLQLIYVEEGVGQVTVNNIVQTVNEGNIVVIPAGQQHRVETVGGNILRFFTIYIHVNEQFYH